MRRFPIRMKLSGALAVPLAALVVVTVLEVVSASSEAARVHDQSALAEITLGPAGILTAIEQERNAVGVYMLDMADLVALEVEEPVAAAEMTGDVIDPFRQEVNRQGKEVVDAYTPAFAALDTLDDIRADVAAMPLDNRGLSNIENLSGTLDRYSAVIDALVDANRKVAVTIDDPYLRQGVELVDLNTAQTNLVALLVTDLLHAELGETGPGYDTPAEISQVATDLNLMHQNYDLMVSVGTGDFAPLIEDLLAAEEVQRFPQVVEESLETGVIDLEAALAYATNDDPETLSYTVFAEQVEDLVIERAAELESAALARQRWFAALAIAAVALATGVTWLVSRSITRPLRSLTRQAKDMADSRLPDAVVDILNTPLGDDVSVPTVEPVTVHTRDEVADVAVALNTVQDTALDLAVEQAVLRRNIADSFVNLGRRNQNLLGRQLDFITELETNETDPDTLANLFRLDHLATRMRRNAESLLVLAGIEPPRKWAAPVRLTDVIRAALGEVEDYQRVTVRGVEPATIIGNAAADLAHLLAELIENALVFSPPDQTVDIRGRQNPNGYTLAIIDSGLGMPTTDINAANRRLAGAESFTIAPSKYLGHYVAGNLAARHNITVTLDNSPGNGITATIDVPPTLLTADDSQVAAPVTPPHGHRALGGTTAVASPARALSWPPPAPDHAAPGQTEPFTPLEPLGAGQPVPAAAPWPAQAGRPAAAAPATALGRTPSGLVKRAPRAPAHGDAAAGSRADDDSLLASLGPYARGRGLAPATPPTAPSASSLHAPPPPAPADLGSRGPVAGGGPAPTGGLTRRVRGAQLPTTRPVPIRGSAAAGTRERPMPVAPPAADDVYRFLSAFSEGVRRGLDASGRDGTA